MWSDCMNILFEISDTLIIGVVAVIFLIIVIIAFFIKAHNRKVKPIDDDDRYDADDFPSIKIKEIPKEELTEEQLEAKSELERVYNMMSQDLEKQADEPDDIEEFEREQEENAIISYQELMAQAEKLKNEADRYERMAEETADMEVKDAMDTYSKQYKQETIRKRQVNSPKRESKPNYRSFKSSDIVSPIYGVQSNKNMIRQKDVSKKKKNEIISKAYGQKHFEEEKTQNLDFLNSLKEFRKNL